MHTLTQTDPELLDEIKPPLLLWKESVGKVFKLTSKSYGARTVTYTRIKAVKETATSTDFEIEVACAEIIARVSNSKRGHSSICKDGIIQQNEESIITPSSFGEECRVLEFEKISGSILAHATMNLDLVMQSHPEEDRAIAVPIDLPHLKLTDMEASLVRNSPFLVRDIYLLSTNSRLAALESINQELIRSSRNSRLTDASDSVYVEQKNSAVISLRKKINDAPLEISSQRSTIAPTLTSVPAPPQPRRETAPMEDETNYNGTDTPEPKNSVPNGRRPGLSLLEKDSLALALLGKVSAANLSWEVQNPSKEGAVYRIGKVCGLLVFVRWAHLTGRAVSEKESAGKNVRTYFTGPDAIYAGPEKDGIYPILKPE